MKHIKVEFSNERIIPIGGLTVVGAILGESDFVKRCNRMDVTPNRSQHQIKNGDILLTYIGMLCMGKRAFDSVHEFDDARNSINTPLVLRAVSHRRKPCASGWTALGTLCVSRCWLKMSKCCV